MHIREPVGRSAAVLLPSVFSLSERHVGGHSGCLGGSAEGAVFALGL